MTKDPVPPLLKRLRRGDVAALARAISMVENARPGFEALLSALHEDVGRAHRLGITGPPGAGKSTLTERLVEEYRSRKRTVAVVAVDPTSPFSGGALLGDRIRMESVAMDDGVFIRSMATRGATGGLATTTREVCDVLDAFGFQRIIVETVGVGQSELAVAGTADSAVLVLVPESGDGIQVLKAGVMEMATVFVVNKADRPDAARLQGEVEVMLGIRTGRAFRHVEPHHHPGGSAAGILSSRTPTPQGAPGWTPPVLQTVAVTGEGVPALADALERHVGFLQESGELVRQRRARLAQHTRDVVDRALRQMVWSESGGEAVLAGELGAVVSGDLSPYEVAEHIVAGFRKGMRHAG